MRLTIVPCDLDEAQDFVRRVHRTHPEPPPGHKFSVAVADETGTVRGVAMVGRPIGRARDDGMTLEVTRVATDGCSNACSALYGAARRAGFALGYTRIGTYTLASEGGASLRAAGWKCLGEAGQKGGKGWKSRPRPRVDLYPNQRKLLWEAVP